MKGMMGLLMLISSVLSFQVMAHGQIAVDGKQYTLTKEDFSYTQTRVYPYDKKELVAKINLNGDDGQKLYFDLSGMLSSRRVVSRPREILSSRGPWEILQVYPRKKIIDKSEYKYLDFTDGVVSLSCSNIAIGEDNFNFKLKEYLLRVKPNSPINEKIMIFNEIKTGGKCKQLEIRITQLDNPFRNKPMYNPSSVRYLYLDNINLKLNVLEKY